MPKFSEFPAGFKTAHKRPADLGNPRGRVRARTEDHPPREHLTTEQKTIVAAVRSGQSVVVSSRAGCGKTTLINTAVKQITGYHTTVICLAPSAMAASHMPAITVNGTELRDACTIAFFLANRGMRSDIRAAQQTRLVVVVDEVFMMVATDFTKLIAAVNALQIATVQFVLVGDEMQLLPPKGIVFLACAAWRKFAADVAPRFLTLSVHMRAQDQEMVALLKALENRDWQAATNWIKTVQISATRTPPPGTVAICFSNARCDRHNDQAYHDYERDAGPGSCIHIVQWATDETGEKTLRVVMRAFYGMPVRVTENLPEYTAINGTLGTLDAVSGDRCTDLQELTQTDVRHRVFWLNKNLRATIRIKDETDHRSVCVAPSARHNQPLHLPLVRAVAITIYAAQGCTIDRKVVINLDCPGLLRPADLYVAASRVRRLDQLFFVPQSDEHYKQLLEKPVDPHVAAFQTHYTK
jgi:hypothetical protein